jgi:hypothetical protein
VISPSEEQLTSDETGGDVITSSTRRSAGCVWQQGSDNQVSMENTTVLTQVHSGSGTPNSERVICRKMQFLLSFVGNSALCSSCRERMKNG